MLKGLIMTIDVNKEELVKQLMRKLHDDSLQATFDTDEVGEEVGEEIGANKDIHEKSANKLIELRDISTTNNESHRYYDLMPHANFFNPLGYCFSNLDHKTILLSALTIADDIPLVKDDLINLSQALVDLDQSSGWHLKIISNYFKPYVLLNAFLTNNEEPQILLLGKEMYNEFYMTYSSIYDQDETKMRETAEMQGEQLQYLTYSWHIDHPSQWYRDQLYSLDSNLNWDRSLKLIDERFAKRYKRIMANINSNSGEYIDYPDNEIQYFKTAHILTLDLDWFMSDLGSKIFGTDADPVLYNTESNQEKFEDPKIQQILEQLANNLS